VSCAAACHAIGALPELRSTMVTVFGSASRWLTLTWKSAALAPESEPEPGAVPGGLCTMPPIPMPLAPFLPRPRDEEERMLDEASGTGGVLTDTVSPPPGPPAGSCDGVESRSWDEWPSEVMPRSAAVAAAAAPTAPSVTADSTACRIGRDRCRGGRGLPSGPRGASGAGAVKRGWRAVPVLVVPSAAARSLMRWSLAARSPADPVVAEPLPTVAVPCALMLTPAMPSI
jgi:hypothetical protein